MNMEIIVAFVAFLSLVFAWVILPGEGRPAVEATPAIPGVQPATA